MFVVAAEASRIITKSSTKLNDAARRVGKEKSASNAP